MSNLRINIRFLMWHLQVTDVWRFSISYNRHHNSLKYGVFEVYDWQPFKKIS